MSDPATNPIVIDMIVEELDSLVRKAEGQSGCFALKTQRGRLLSIAKQIVLASKEKTP